MTIEGKTKIIKQTGTPGEVVLMTKDSLTGGDAAKKEHIEGIAVHKVTQASNVFRLLNERGVPTAFINRQDEWVHRLPRVRHAPARSWSHVGLPGAAILKRAPELVSTKEKPIGLIEILTELFHKHAVVMPPLVRRPVQMKEDAARELYLRDGVWADGGVHRSVRQDRRRAMDSPLGQGPGRSRTTLDGVSDPISRPKRSSVMVVTGS